MVFSIEYSLKGPDLIFTDPDDDSRTVYQLDPSKAFYGNESTELQLWRPPKDSGRQAVVVKKGRERNYLVGERFKNAATLLRELQEEKTHDHIIQLFDELPFDQGLVLEYVPGSDLFDYLVSNETLSPPQYQDVMRQCWDALAWMHRHGVIHVDLKIENVLLQHSAEEELHAKLCDFVDARKESDAPDINYLATGTNIARSPELLTVFVAAEEVRLCKVTKEQMPQKSDDVYAMAVLMLNALHINYRTVVSYLLWALDELSKGLPDKKPHQFRKAHDVVVSGSRYEEAKDYVIARNPNLFLSDPSGWKRGEVEAAALQQPENQQYDAMSRWSCEIDGKSATALTLFQRCLQPRSERPTAAEVVSWLTPRSH